MFGLQSHTTAASQAAARTAASSSAQAASGPKRGTAMTRRHVARSGRGTSRRSGRERPPAHQDGGCLRTRSRTSSAPPRRGSPRSTRRIGRRGGRQASIIGRWILGQRRLERPAASSVAARSGGAARCRGRTGRWTPSAHRTEQQPARGRLPAVGRGRGSDVKVTGFRLIGSPRRDRNSTASRWANNPSASASVATVSRIEARPSRSTRWTCTNFHTFRRPGTGPAASPPVGGTWLAPVA